MPAYTTNIPQPTDTLAISQNQLLGNTNYVQAWGNTDHNFSLNTTNPTDGHHTVIQFVPTIGPLPLNPGTIWGRLFTQTVTPSMPVGYTADELFYQSGSTTPGPGMTTLADYVTQLTGGRFADGTKQNQITPPIPGAPAGWVWLPGPLLVQWATISGPFPGGARTFAAMGLKDFPTQCFGGFWTNIASPSTSIMFMNNFLTTSVNLLSTAGTQFFVMFIGN